MKDIEERSAGKYSEDRIEVIDNIKTEITETTIVGRNFEILNFVREYNPPIKFKI